MKFLGVSFFLKKYMLSCRGGGRVTYFFLLVDDKKAPSISKAWKNFKIGMLVIIFIIKIYLS